ncbi:hypothetical protein ACET3Z_001958 [Daucus carota]
MSLIQHSTNLNHLLQIHALILKTALDINVVVLTKLLGKILTPIADDISYARNLFDTIPQPDTFMFNTMIRGYLKSNNPEESLSLFTRMCRFDGICIDSFSLSVVLQSCGKLFDSENGGSLHANCLKHGFGSDLFVQTALIEMYGRFGLVDVSRKVFDEIKDPDCISCNVMLGEYVRVREMGLAEEFFDKISDRDLVSWNTMIHGYASIGDVESAQDLFDTIVMLGFMKWRLTLCRLFRLLYSVGTAGFERWPCIKEQTPVPWQSITFRMAGKKHNYNSWEERTISEVNVEYHLRSCSGNSLLAAVGNENREGRMTYVVAKEYLEAFGSNATINAYTQWRNRHDVVQWLISLVRNDDSLPALSDSYLVPKNKRHGSSIDEEEKPAQGNPIKSFRKKLRSSLVHQKQDTGRSNAINLVPPKEAGPSEPTDSNLVPKNKRHGSSIDEEEKPAQGNPIKSFRKKLRSSLVHQKQDTGRSNAINLVPPKEAGPSEPTDSDLVPKNKRHGSSIDEEEKPAQGNPIKSFRKKLRSSLVHQKQDTGRSNAINLVPPKEAGPSEPTDSDLVPKNKRHGSSIDEEEKPAQRYPIKSFPKKLRSSLVHQKQDTGRSNAINLVPPKEAAASEPTGQFTPGEYSNRVEIFCGIPMRTLRGLCTLVKEPLCNSPKYKFDDNRELTVGAKVAIAMRRLKLGKSLNSIGNEIGMHSFTADKVTRSFVEAVNGLSHPHGPGAATEEGMSAETLDSAVEEGMSVEKLDRLKEEWKVLTTGMKPEKLRSMIKACCILHNIVTDMND